MYRQYVSKDKSKFVEIATLKGILEMESVHLVYYHTNITADLKMISALVFWWVYTVLIL